MTADEEDPAVSWRVYGEGREMDEVVVGLLARWVDDDDDVDVVPADESL